MKVRMLFFALFALLLLNSCGDDTSSINLGGGTNPPNIILIIADDMGLDATSGYPEGAQKPNTPHLDSLMASGLKFNNFWVNPTCTPTRSTIITGKYGSNTGVLAVGDVLPSSHLVLQSYINQNTNNAYATAVVGKWHLAGSNADDFNPETLGIDYYAGLLAGATNSYTLWSFTEDGSTTIETEYITKKFTNLASDWIDNQNKPWFLWLAYTAPHTPFHVPPADMHTQGNLPSDEASINANPRPYYFAAIEAMDYQIGELLDGLTQEERENTTLIFIGDNGSPGQVAQAPYARSKAKGTIYQGGINTPMFITGANVKRTGTENALLNGTDLYATIASFAGVNVQHIHNSQNFEELLEQTNPDFRDYVYSELKKTNDNSEQWAMRDKTYKLIESTDGSQEFYNLISDPYEKTNLLNGTLTTEEATAKANLETAIQAIRG